MLEQLNAKITKYRFSLESSNSGKKTMDNESYPGGNKRSCLSATKADPNHYEFE